VKITAEKDEQSQYIVRVEIETAELNDAKGKAARKLSNKVRIPGFRPGKAPRALVERVVGPEAMMEEATKILLPQAYKEALQDKDIRAIGDPIPNIESLDPLTIVLTIPVEPSVEVGDYKSIRQDYTEVVVDEAEVDKAIEQLRDQNSTWEEPEGERPAQDGDRVELEMTTLRDGEPTGEPFMRTGILGKGELLGQIDDQVTGMAVSEEKVIEVKKPAPAKVEETAVEAEEPAQEAAEIPDDLPEVETIPDEEEDTGPLTFNAKLVSIKVKNEPALDDAFAASVSDLQSLDELKGRIRKNLVTQKEEETKRELVDKIVKEAVESSKVVVPPIMIDSEIHAMEDNMAQRLKQQKLSLDQYLSIVGKSHEDFHEELRPQAISRINTALVLREIATAEGIAVSGDELDREVEKMVDEYISSTPEDQREEQTKRFRDIFNQKEMRNQFSENIFSRKLAERLMELATGKSFATGVVEVSTVEVDSSEETPEADATEPATTEA